MIRGEQLRVGYGPHLVLDRVDLTAHSGAVIGLVGPNGSGKTTLLRALYRALRPLGGRVVIDDIDVSHMRRRHIATRVAVVAQEPVADTPVTVAESVLLGRLPHHATMLRPRRADIAIVERSLQQVGVAHLADRLMSALSGGERQRVLIARAIVQQAGHLLLDEPTNHLDVRYQHEIMRLVRTVGTTTVVVLHDLNLAATYCDTVVLLHHGRVVASGPVEAVLTGSILEPVYDMTVHVIDRPHGIQLLFEHPADLSTTPAAPATAAGTST